MNPTPGRRIALSGLMTATAVLGGNPAHATAQILAAEWHGTHEGAMGSSLANAGDVDADGVDDLLVGEPSYSTTVGEVGRLWVYSGRTFTVIRSHDGTQHDESFGYYAAAMGDVDGDGHGEYAIGGNNFDTATHDKAGRITAWDGKSGHLIWTVEGSSDRERLGAGLVAISDRNNDGKFQLLSLQGQDQVVLFDSYGSVIRTLQGDDGSGFGVPAARCKDLDGDGRDDFLVAAPYWGNGTESNPGEVRE